MPYGEPEAGDPFEFVALGLPSGPEATCDMAYTFAEEFARLGYSEQALMALFINPHYRGAHGAYETLGKEKVRQIVQECVGVWGRVRYVDREAAE